MVKMPSKVGKKVVGLIMRVPKAKKMEGVVTSSGLGELFRQNIEDDIIDNDHS